MLAAEGTRGWLEHVVVTLWSGDIERRFFDSLTGRIVPDSACKCTILIDEFDGKTGVVADINWKGFITWKSHLKVLSCFFEDYLVYSCRYQAWFMVQKLYLFIWKYSLIIKNYIKYSSRYRDVCIVLKYLIFSPIMSGVQFSDIDKSR